MDSSMMVPAHNIPTPLIHDRHPIPPTSNQHRPPSGAMRQSTDRFGYHARLLNPIALKGSKLTSGKKVLITGWEIAEGLSPILAGEGYAVKLIRYHGGPIPFDEVLSELSREKYDLVIVALWNLWDVLLKIRQDFPEVKTIFLNSYKYEWDEIAKRKGVNAVVRVPFEGEELFAAIEKVMTS